MGKSSLTSGTSYTKYEVNPAVQSSSSRIRTDSNHWLAEWSKHKACMNTIYYPKTRLGIKFHKCDGIIGYQESIELGEKSLASASSFIIASNTTGPNCCAAEAIAENLSCHSWELIGWPKVKCPPFCIKFNTITSPDLGLMLWKSLAKIEVQGKTSALLPVKARIVCANGSRKVVKLEQNKTREYNQCPWRAKKFASE